jgi:hypothetical protein
MRVNGEITVLSRRLGSAARNGSRWKPVLVIPLAMLLGCELSTTPGTSGMRVLAPPELDRITVGAASASIDLAAYALPPAAQTVASTSTLAISGSSSVAGPPFLNNLSQNFSTSQGMASATSSQLAQTTGSSHTAVSGVNGGAAIDAAGASLAAGPGLGQTELSLQFQGFSTARVDLVYGTAIATACCAPGLSAQVAAGGEAGGPYSAEMQAHPHSDQPGQVQSRVDIAVASSAFPIIDPGQMMSLLISRGSPLN